MNRKLLIYPDICIGCNLCEISCSYHHSKKFSRKNSSIYIRRIDNKGKIDISIYNKLSDNRPACDLCFNEILPLCVKNCWPGALVLGEK